MRIRVFASRLATFVGILATAGFCGAEVRSIDWEYGSSSSCAPKWEFYGLRVTNARGTICVNSSPFVTNGTHSCNDIAGMVVRHIHGMTFSPLTIDLGEYYSTSNTDQTIHFVGHKSDGTTVNTSFDLDLLADGPGGTGDFQNFTFPLDFANIIRLEVPNTRWRFDNLTFATVVPPPLPVDQRLGPAFQSSTLLYSESGTQNTLVIGPDYQFVSGFQPTAPTRTKFLLPESTALVSFTTSPHFDRADQALHFTTPNTYSVKKYKSGVTTDVAGLSDPLTIGITVTTISKPRAAGERLLFLGTHTQGQDDFYLFQKKNGVTTALVTPNTLLPIGNSTSTPHAFPTDLIINADSYAFDTSLDSSTTRKRLFASFKGKPIRHVIGETDPIDLGTSYTTVIDIVKFEFTASGEIKVRAELGNGMAWLYFTEQGFSRMEEIFTTVAPVNAGKQLSGELFRSVPGVRFLEDGGELFREHDGLFYRVLGVRDTIGGEAIASLDYKATRETLPLRVIVEVSYASSATTARILELLLDPPVAVAPRFGASSVHPESGDLFIPVSHLTFGREYWLRGSNNLSEWTDLWKIEEIVPLQNIAIPRSLLNSPAFFRVEQR